MRILKNTLLAVVLLMVGFVAFIFLIEPSLWPGQQKRESIRLLSAAKTPDELKNVVTNLGAFITQTNGGWIAIRYRESHILGPLSKAVALDSEGHWFESEKPFSGEFRSARALLDRERRYRAESPKLFTNVTESIYFKPGTPSEPYYRLFLATNLETARKELLGLGFREFKR
jgi:hypothetical protein